MAEKMNRTLQDRANALLVSSGMNVKFWPSALEMACFLHNRVDKSGKDPRTPFERLHGFKPTVDHLQPFGTTCWVLDDKAPRWGPRCKQAVLIGYDESNDGCKVRIVENGGVVFSRNVTFTKPSPPPVRETRFRGSYAFVAINDDNDNDHPLAIDALNGPDKEKWHEAAMQEKRSLIDKRVYEAVHPSQVTKKPISSKLDFRKKKDALGNLTRFKARLVARGFVQRPGVDYFETYAPTCRPQTVRSFLVAADVHKLLVHQVDVETAYLNAPLEEEIFIELPAEILEVGEPQVVRLRKALYGLKQSAHAWHQMLRGTLEREGWKRSVADDCLFHRKVNDSPQLLAVYVDDILIATRTTEEMNIAKEEIRRHFAIKDAGEVEHLLGVHVTRSNWETHLSQLGLIEEAVAKFQKDLPFVKRTTPGDGPLAPYTGQASAEDALLFKKVIGTANHLAQWTRPEIATTLSHLSRHSKNPGPEHFDALKQLLGYLEATKANKLVLKEVPTERTITVYADAEWAGDVTDRKSQNGFAIKLCGRLVSWKSTKQECVTTSTMESEYVALSLAASEAKWIHFIATDLYLTKAGDPMSLLSDNQATVASFKASSQNSRARHIDIKYRHVRDEVEKGMFINNNEPTKSNQADVFTKALGKAQHTNFTQLIGVTAVGSVSVSQRTAYIIGNDPG
jgi:hypothetical protein